MQQLKIPTERGVLLDGVLFDVEGARPDTAVIAITGIHGNFYSNPFYVNFGETLNSGGVDFVYAQTCDAFGQIATMNAKTGERVVIGSQTEDFNDAVEDVRAYVDWAEQAGYDALSAEIAAAMRDVLGIPPERVYVRYADIPVWSVADMVVDRRMFA